jgi:hypothetical protein
MPRLILIAGLLAAQAISWNASPIFLCFDADGEVCVDLGPSACNCCRHQHGPEDDDASPGQHVSESSCDCQHLQITAPWTPVTLTSDVTHAARVFGLPGFVVEDGRFLPPPPAASESTLLRTSEAPCYQTSARAVILRC